MVSSWKDNWKDNFRACKVKKPTVQTTTDNKRAEMAIKTDAKQTVHTFSPISPVVLMIQHHYGYFWIA